MPRLPLNERLEFQPVLNTDSARIGLEPGDRLAAIDGIRVEPGKFAETVARFDGAPDELVFVRGEGGSDEVRVVLDWREQATPPRIQLNELGEFQDPSDPSGRYQGKRVVSVRGKLIPDDVDPSTLEFGRLSSSFALVFAASDGVQRVLAFTIVDWTSQSITYFAGLTIVFIGAVLILLRANARYSWGFLGFCGVLGLFTMVRATPWHYRGVVEHGLFVVLQCVLPAATLAFFVSYVPFFGQWDRSIPRRYGVGLLIAGLAPACIAAFDAYRDPSPLYLAPPVIVGLSIYAVPFCLGVAALSPLGRRLAIPQFTLLLGIAISGSLLFLTTVYYWGDARAGLLGEPLFMAWGIILLIIVGAALISDRFSKHPDEQRDVRDRQRVRLLRIAVLYSFTPMFLYILIRQGLRVDLFEPRAVVEATQILFPGVMAYGIARQNILQLNTFLFESVSYVFALILGLLAYVVTAAYALPRLEGFGSVPDRVIEGIGLIVFLVAGIAVYRAIHHRFGPGRESLDEGFETRFFDRLHALSVRSTSVAGVWDTVEREVKSSLDLTSAHLVLGDSGSSGRVNTADPRGSRHSVANLLQRVESRDVALFLRDLEDNVRPSEESVGAIEVFRELDGIVALPVRAEDDFLGVLVAGPRLDGQNFSRRDLRFLERLSRRTGDAIFTVRETQKKSGPVRAIDLYPGHPDSFAGYRLLRPLGQGGMSFVYLASKNGQDSALKIANHRVQMSNELRSRFEREAEIVSQLDHPHILRILDTGSDNGEPYHAFEYAARGSLAESVGRGGRLNATALRAMTIDVVEALSHAQEKGVIHRDIKPHNIYAMEDGTIKLADFGAARWTEDEAFTFTGEIVGTMMYMSPEQLGGEDVDWRVDQYGLGVTVFELATGEKPFNGRTLETQLATKLQPSGELRKILERSVDSSFAEVVMRLSAPGRDDRYSSYAEVLEALQSR